MVTITRTIKDNLVQDNIVRVIFIKISQLNALDYQDAL